MKLKKVLSICKTNGLYYLYDRIDRSGEITQWLGDGYALYPLDGLPILDEESFCAVFDIIGNWGDFTFYVSADQIKTFDSLKWDSAAKYSTHDRHLREPLLEFTGTDVETITFTMFFSVFLGVNPIKEIASLLQAMRRGEVNRLVIGPKAYGTNKWVITKLSNSLKRFDRWGNLLVASVNVTMQSYAVR